MHNDKRNRPVCLVHCMQTFYDHQRHKGEGIVHATLWASKRKNSRLGPPLSMPHSPTKETYEVIILKYTWC